MSVDIKVVTGAGISPWLDELARLRIQVFRDFPYLYDGTMAYERQYLASYSACTDSVFVLALAGEGLVGAATAIPLAQADAAFQKPFLERDMAIDSVLYLGESVLDARWRGRGIGHAFFDGREAHARHLGLPVTSFCAVFRPDDHAARPADYRPLDPFWQQRGYQPQPGMLTDFSWQDIGAPGNTAKPMQFWLRHAGA